MCVIMQIGTDNAFFAFLVKIWIPILQLTLYLFPMGWLCILSSCQGLQKEPRSPKSRPLRPTFLPSWGGIFKMASSSYMSQIDKSGNYEWLTFNVILILSQVSVEVHINVGKEWVYLCLHSLLVLQFQVTWNSWKKATKRVRLAHNCSLERLNGYNHVRDYFVNKSRTPIDNVWFTTWIVNESRRKSQKILDIFNLVFIYIKILRFIVSFSQSLLLL